MGRKKKSQNTTATPMDDQSAQTKADPLEEQGEDDNEEVESTQTTTELPKDTQEIAIEGAPKDTPQLPNPQVATPTSTQETVKEVHAQPHTSVEQPSTTGTALTPTSILDYEKISKTASQTNLAADTAIPQSTHHVAMTPTTSKEDDIKVVTSDAAKEVPNTTESLVGTALSSLSSWYTSAKQIVLEKVGKAKVSEDPELQNKINQLKEVKMYYEELTILGNNLCAQHLNTATTMNQIGVLLSALAVKDKDTVSMKKVAESYKSVSRNTQAYVGSVQTFYGNVSHFKDKALEDTFETVQKYEQLRFEYDVALTQYNQWEESEHAKPTKSKQYLHAQEEMEKAKEKYERIREDLSTKMDTLNHKRVTDMEFQLAAYLKNMAAFYSNSLFLVNKFSSASTTPPGTPQSLRHNQQPTPTPTEASAEKKEEPQSVSQPEASNTVTEQPAV